MWPQTGYQGQKTLSLGPGGYAVGMLGTVTLITGEKCIVIPPGPADFKTTT